MNPDTQPDAPARAARDHRAGPAATPQDARGFDHGRRLQLARRACWLGAGVLAIFVPVDLFLTGYLVHAAIEAAAAVLLLVVAGLLRDARHLETAQVLGALAVALVIVVVVTTGLAADGVLVWAALFPPIPFFLFGSRSGLLVSGAFGVALLAALIAGMPGSGYSWVAPLSAGGALAAATALAFLYEQARSEAARLLVESANTDPLTGIPNRRALLDRFDYHQAIALRSRRPLALLVFDLDRLKCINDRYGHAAGDLAICHVARLVRARCRRQDLLARVGGDEFALLLPDTDVSGALHLADALRETLRAQPLQFGTQQIDLTLSLGAAALTAATADFDSLFAQADRHLYAAKQQGRDRQHGG